MSGPPDIASGLADVQQQGYTVLQDVIPIHDLHVVRERLLADLPLVLARSDVPYNWNPGNCQQAPPRQPAYLFSSILFNPAVCALSRAMLGDAAINDHYTGNTALPGSPWRQPVHIDYRHLWPAQAGIAPPHGLIINVPLVDMEPANGAIEIWPGSHRIVPTDDGRMVDEVPESMLRRRRVTDPPLQVTLRAGSVLMRDIRLWHAGMPNPSAQVRPLLAMIHWAPWWWDLEVLAVPAETRPFFATTQLRTSLRFVDEAIDHTRLGQAHGYVAPPPTALAATQRPTT